MSIILYNSKTRRKEEFKPIHDGRVSMYSCGPTVYNVPHIGNYRAYLFDDVAARVFVYNGFDVTHVMNITDVDDKTIKNARAAGMLLSDFTAQYTEKFLEDLAELNIQSITYHPKATLHISEMIDLITDLLDKKAAYKGEDGSIYFSIQSFGDYGALSHLEKQALQADASGRVKNDEYSKESPQDFALWKSWNEEDGEVYWDAPFGKGRPGWHIECSAMSMKYLGTHFDIHAGGIDLLFPHHENEIAQSESSTGSQFVNYWIHNEWLLVNGSKMAKRDGNFITLRDILDRSYQPLAYRFLCLQTHYRQQLNFTFDVLDAAQNGYRNLVADVQHIANKSKEHLNANVSDQLSSKIDTVKIEFRNSINQDFNTPKGLAVLFEFIKYIHHHGTHFSSLDFQKCLDVIKEFDAVFALGLEDIKPLSIPDHIAKLVAERDAARTAKQFQQSDELRALIESEGYVVEDTSSGTRISRL